MLIKDVTKYLESIAPPSYQESYDNAGLLTGNPEQEVTGILVTLDCIEEVVKEAIQMKCNLIIAHHPIVFKGLKRIVGSNYIERTIIQAIRNNIAIYAIHTNLDNVVTGVNKKICDIIGLKNTRILSPKKDTLSKLVTFVPPENCVTVLDALYHAGAGKIENYSHCSFQTRGVGSFMPSEMARPYIGKQGKLEEVEETRIEVLLSGHLEKRVIEALHTSHPYEVPAYYLTQLQNENQEVGSGMTGDLSESMEPKAFLGMLKERMDLKLIRHTKAPAGKMIKKVAVCGGAGSFLLPKAKSQHADIFISADFKYHEFFDADNQIIIADIGHYESEVFTKDLIIEYLMKKFPTFAINFSKTVTNPISYL